MNRPNCLDNEFRIGSSISGCLRAVGYCWTSPIIEPQWYGRWCPEAMLRSVEWLPHSLHCSSRGLVGVQGGRERAKVKVKVKVKVR